MYGGKVVARATRLGDATGIAAPHLLPTNAGYCPGPETWVKLPGNRGPRVDMVYYHQMASGSFYTHYV
jgi:hypothetical protein